MSRLSWGQKQTSKIFKLDIFILFFFAFAILILWQMLLPGFILTLDMVFAPEIEVVASTEGFRNFLPIAYLLQGLDIFIPAWLIQKVVLFILFFNLGYFSFKFLPLPKDTSVRLFSALIYTVNPFVYSRFLAGHWSHLMAYAFLPIFIHFLFGFTRQPSFRSSLGLCASIFLISLFSVHFFLMAAMIAAIWFLYCFYKYWLQKDLALFKLTFKNLVVGAALFLLAGSYWLIPAAGQAQSIWQKFDIKHWQAFAASGYEGVNTTLNVLSLNGFWGQGQAWAAYFSWPQDYLVFWLGFLLLVLLILVGLISGFRNNSTRQSVVFFAILGLLAFIFSTGVGETAFKDLNLWLYNHVFFWSGFRDSQKFSGLLALSYAVLSGLGASAVFSFLGKRRLVLIKNLNLIVLIPLSFGSLALGGFWGQLQPVWYPDVWNQAKEIVGRDSSNAKFLILPWHGYLSFKFNNNIVIANPARKFFGEGVIVSRSVELGEIYDQEHDPEYRQLDQVVRGAESLTTYETINFFAKQNIKYIIYFQELKETDDLQYEFLGSNRLRRILIDRQLIMYEIRPD